MRHNWSVTARDIEDIEAMVRALRTFLKPYGYTIVENIDTLYELRGTSNGYVFMKVGES